MKKVLIMPLKHQEFFGAMTIEKHCFFCTVFSNIIKIDEQRFFYIDPCIHVNSQNSWEIIKNLPGQNGLKSVWRRIDIYKTCKPAACSFMKKLTHLQWFKDLINFVKGHILRNSLECRLHIIFVIFFLNYNIAM